MLIIAHRLATVKNCDVIIVMEQGEIIEQGSHEELLSKKGQYYRLWEMQQGNFVLQDEQVMEDGMSEESEDDLDSVMSYS